MQSARRVVHGWLTAMPQGRPLPWAAWQRRHRGMLAVLWTHVAAFVAVSQMTGDPRPLLFAAAIGTAGAFAVPNWLARPWRAALVTVGLLTASTAVVHVSGGQAEAHLHVFVVLAVVSLYHQWLVFLLAIAFLGGHHLVIAAIDPAALFAAPAALQQPLLTVGIHMLAIAAASGVFLVSWRLTEEQRDRGERVLSATSDALFGVDRAGVVTFANPALERLVGAPEDALLGRHHHDVLGHSRPDGVPYDRGMCRMCTAVEGADGTTHADDTVAGAGQRIPVELRANPVLERGQRTGTVVTLRDLTEQAQLVRRALHDPLTGLPNRELFDDHLRRALARLRRHANLVAVLFIDLDRFKVINDSLGHRAGDELLIAVAGRMRDALRNHDTVARFGGDEFVVLCDDLTAEEQAVAIASRINESLARPFTLAGQHVVISASVGITLARSGDCDPEALLRDADAAMYRAKERGRNTYEVFDDSLHQQAVERFELEGDLRRALERDELLLHYQPKVDLRDGRIIGVEALVRWQHPTRGLLYPGSFVPLAEETGLVVDLGARVLWLACAQAQRWRTTIRSCRYLVLSVNVSGRQLLTPGLVDTVAEVLAATGLPASRLCLEITESVLLEDVIGTKDVLCQLKALGVEIAVDDFGTGYSSLAYLTRLPVDQLKVDRSFVDELDGGQESWSIIAAVLALSRALGLDAVAEGVEHERQLTALRQLGCELGQGYHLARPAPPADIAALLRTGLPVPAVAAEQLPG